LNSLTCFKNHLSYEEIDTNKFQSEVLSKVYAGLMENKSYSAYVHRDDDESNYKKFVFWQDGEKIYG